MNGTVRAKATICLFPFIWLAALACASANEEKVIYSFAGGSDGALPRAPLTLDSDGNLYGTTQLGGAACDCGTVYKLTPNGKKTTLYKFAGGTAGEQPNGGLILDDQRQLYGTTVLGGDGFGVVFKVSMLVTASTGKAQVLHTFDGSDGDQPRFGMTMAHGNMYGTTSFGGQYGGGTAFQIAPNGKFKLLHSLGTMGDGVLPTNLVQAPSHTFLGTADAGGANNSGIVFTMTNRGDVRVIYTFSSAGGSDGFEPNGDIVQDKNERLYGTTVYGGGANNEGTVFSLAPDGTETILHAFAGGADGDEPSGGLVKSSDGNFYGATAYGGPGTACFAGGCGTVFKITPDGVVTILYTFTGGADGSNPYGTLIKDGDRGFYGVTPEGGAFGFGTVFWVKK